MTEDTARKQLIEHVTYFVKPDPLALVQKVMRSFPDKQ